MYIPKYSLVTDKDEIFGIIESNSFGTLITGTGNSIKAAHIPMLLDRTAGENGTLLGHISSANDLFRENAGEALAIFQGPHSYISSSWYETNQSVPTWNYVAVHAYGKVLLHEDYEEKLENVRKLVQHFERADSGYSVSLLEKNYLDKLLKGITVFSMKIDRLEGKKKLSQNHYAQRQELVIANLEKSNDGNDLAVAELMKENLNKNGKR